MKKSAQGDTYEWIWRLNEGQDMRAFEHPTNSKLLIWRNNKHIWCWEREEEACQQELPGATLRAVRRQSIAATPSDCSTGHGKNCAPAVPPAAIASEVGDGEQRPAPPSQAPPPPSENVPGHGSEHGYCAPPLEPPPPPPSFPSGKGPRYPPPAYAPRIQDVTPPKVDIMALTEGARVKARFYGEIFLGCIKRVNEATGEVCVYWESEYSKSDLPVGAIVEVL